MKTFIASMLCAAVLSAANLANAAIVLNFGQQQSGTPANFTTNGTGGLLASGTNILIDITLNNLGLPTNTPAYFTYAYTGTFNPLTPGMGAVTGGSFSITSGSGGVGTNYLSGTFDGGFFAINTNSAAFGSTVGGNVISFTSDLATILPPLDFTWGFSQVSPAFNQFVAANYTAQVSGNFGGEIIPEAASVAVWGGLSLLGLVARRRRS